METLAGIGQVLSVWLVPVVTAITFHEAAHGWMANRLGDDTALRLGRVTFNPARHVDPLGTFLVPGLLVLVGAPFIFGWAKPVPVAFHRLRKPKRDMIWVALAGPGVNLLMALGAGLLLHAALATPGVLGLWIGENLRNAILVNIILATFNMIPIPPLDGGRVLTGLLPLPLARRFARLEPFGLPLIIGIIFLVPFLAGELGLAFNPVGAALLSVIRVAYAAVLTLTGWG